MMCDVGVVDLLVGLVVKVPCSNPACDGFFSGVESYQ